MSIHMKQKDEQKVPAPTEEEDRRLWDSFLSTRAENFFNPQGQRTSKPTLGQKFHTTILS